MSYFTYGDMSLYYYPTAVASKTISANIQQPKRLNQIAWILDHIKVGSYVTGSQLWKKVAYSGCTTLTASDFQAAFWGLIMSTAYLWNKAFNAVPDGSSYVELTSNE
eukprot:gene37146-50110_t